MSKNKRGFQAPSSGGSGAGQTTPPSQPASAPGAATPAASGGGTTPAGGMAPASPGSASSSGSSSRSSRAAARRSAPPPKVTPTSQGFFERYRTLIIGGGVVVVVLAIGALFLSSATAAPYSCKSLMTPGPVEPAPTPRPDRTAGPVASALAAASLAPDASPAAAATSTPAATPAPQPTQRLGFVAQDLGAGHVSDSTSVSYAYCPPTSGQHFSSNMAPLPRRFYGPDDALKPGNWVHNLEHGYVVLLYKGTPPQDIQDQLKDIVETAPGTAFTTQQCGLPNKVVAARFDDMTTPYGAVSWDRALLLEEFDEAQLRTFAEQWQESDVWPEKGVC